MWVGLLCDTDSFMTMNVKCDVLFTTGPGIKNPEEKTMEYLEEVAINIAKYEWMDGLRYI